MTDSAWQHAIIARDRKCTRCGMIGEDLAGHHLIGRRYKKSRHDLRNGVTVCYQCHQWAHAHPSESMLYFAVERIGAQFPTVEAWEAYKRSIKG